MVPVFLVAGLWNPLAAYQLEIREDKISIEANHVPLRELMRKLSADYGIIVKIDPDINPLITASYKNRKLEDGLKALLKPYNHIFVWKTSATASDGSKEAGYHLDEIHIFKPGQRDRMVSIQEPARTTQDDEASEPGAEQEAEIEGPSETSVLIKNNRVFVPVTIGYDNNEIETTLIFDTGAGSIVLHANVAQQLGIEQGKASLGEGVGGIKIPTNTIQLSYVQVGPHKKENLRADVITYEGDSDTDYNGLLGMNFIRGLKYDIDFDAQVIKWQP